MSIKPTLRSEESFGLAAYHIIAFDFSCARPQSRADAYKFSEHKNYYLDSLGPTLAVQTSSNMIEMPAICCPFGEDRLSSLPQGAIKCLPGSKSNLYASTLVLRDILISAV
jgi:hypothetical protein